MARPPTVSLAPGVWRVPLLRDFINGFILRDDDGQVALLDMGLARHGRKVLEALDSIGSAPSDVTRLLLTHAHSDHAGGAAVVAAATGCSFTVHADDAAYVREGRMPPTDPTFRIGRFAQRFGSPTFTGVEVTEELRDDQVLPIGGGLRVVHTPGHSPGHCSFLHEESGVLVTGDAIFNVLGTRWPVKAFCTDFAMTQRTAHRLGDLDYTVAAFTHGPEIRDGARAAIRKFLGRG